MSEDIEAVSIPGVFVRLGEVEANVRQDGTLHLSNRTGHVELSARQVELIFRLIKGIRE